MNYNYKNFEYSLCVSYNTNLHLYASDTKYSNLPYEIHAWLVQNVGNDNFIFGFEDYNQDGEWMLYTLSKEDLLAFKLRWCDR